MLPGAIPTRPVNTAARSVKPCSHVMKFSPKFLPIFSPKLFYKNIEFQAKFGAKWFALKF